MRLIPIYLILILVACNASDHVMSDAGNLHDGHMLHFDAGNNSDGDTVTPDGSTPGYDAGIATDSGADTTSDTLIQTDVIQTDVLSSTQTDVGPQCDGPASDCGSGTQCGLCIIYWLTDRTRTPGFCFANGAFMNWRTCNGY